MGRQSNKFEALFNDPNLLVGLLNPDGTVQQVNQTAVEYIDQENEEIAGSLFWETPWWGSDDISNVKEWVEQAATGDYVEFEAEHTTPEGDTAVVSGNFRPVTDDTGEVTDIVVSANDITERRRRKRELQAQNKRFDEFASFISHDLQSPISTVNGRLDLALETGNLEHVERAQDSMTRVDALREDLVTTLRSREIVTTRELVPLEDCFAAALRTIDPPPETSYAVTESITVEADREALQRLLENLIGNSIEHGSDDATIHIGSLENGFYYADDGPGIDPDTRGQVFVPGFSTKRGEKGIGMGMASVRQIVTAHDWRIEIADSDTLGGARFELYTT